MSSSTPFSHPSMPSLGGLRLYGQRVMMRPLTPSDFVPFSEVRVRNDRWLTPWEPIRASRVADPQSNERAKEEDR